MLQQSDTVPARSRRTPTTPPGPEYAPLRDALRRNAERLRAWEHINEATGSSTLAWIFHRVLPAELSAGFDASALARTRVWVARACAGSLAGRSAS